eukprot:CAMPEP_0114689452 /NCGR_PEP_ID=MMETSP0191-20121206/64549_1 /TAXON_ID=126664 /ORGANISM="Sorites sp." /LENGTH=124 /DNA_ID=CAMNT_0001978063 /DNA_START=163 /DNA_END=538 /DNA_ORIENTATION=-
MTDVTITEAHVPACADEVQQNVSEEASTSPAKPHAARFIGASRFRSARAHPHRNHTAAMLPARDFANAQALFKLRLPAMMSAAFAKRSKKVFASPSAAVADAAVRAEVWQPPAAQRWVATVLWK